MGCAAQFHATQSAGGGIRNLGRHVEGAAGNRVSTGHGNGILVEPGESCHSSGKVQRIAENHVAGMDSRRPDEALRQVLYLSVLESLAPPVSETASSLLHRRDRKS